MESQFASLLGGLGVGVVIIIVLAVIIGLFFVAQYNGLVRLRNRYRNAFAQIEVQLKRRHDLIPNLVETAKAYMSHEKETLEAVIQARNTAESARSSVSPDHPAAMEKLAEAEGGLGSVLGRFFALSEAYPDLKSNENMKQLSEELTSTENRVAYARQGYNDSVMHYNNMRETFPSSVVAGMFSFGSAVLFEVTDDIEREVVEVKF